MRRYSGTGLRGGARGHSPAGGRLPKIKISNPEEAEHERKIKEIKEINKNRPRFQMVETATVLGGARDNLQLQAKNKVLVPEILCKERNRQSLG